MERLLDPADCFPDPRSGKQSAHPFEGSECVSMARCAASQTGIFASNGCSTAFLARALGCSRKERKETSIRPFDRRSGFFSAKAYPWQSLGFAVATKMLRLPRPSTWLLSEHCLPLDLELMFEEMLGALHYLGPLREYPARQYTGQEASPADMGRRGEAAIAALLSARRRGPEISMGRGARRRTMEEHVAHWLIGDSWSNLIFSR